MAKCKIAVTGGIGCGKSLAICLFKEFGIKTVSCDDLSRDIYKDDAVKNEVVEAFGESVLTAGGKISRKKLSDIVFADKKKLSMLNAIAHPAIIEKMNAFLDAQEGIAVAEVPLLFECGLESSFDIVIVIIRPLNERIKSVCIRSNMTEDEVVKRIQNQFDYENLDKTTHTIIYNDGDVDKLRKKLRCVLSEIEQQLC